MLAAHACASAACWRHEWAYSSNQPCLCTATPVFVDAHCGGCCLPTDTPAGKDKAQDRGVKKPGNKQQQKGGKKGSNKRPASSIQSAAAAAAAAAAAKKKQKKSKSSAAAPA